MRTRMGQAGAALFHDLLWDLRRRLHADDQPPDATPQRPLPWTTQAMGAKVDLGDADAIAAAVDHQ